MTEANRKENIKEELKRASEVFNAAALLAENGFYTDAVSRLYYFVLYHVRALLLTKGLDPKSHEGALRLLGMHFIKTGLFKPPISHIFSKLMKYRAEADYNTSYVFTVEDYVQFKSEAEDAAQTIAAYISEKNYI